MMPQQVGMVNNQIQGLGSSDKHDQGPNSFDVQNRMNGQQRQLNQHSI